MPKEHVLVVDDESDILELLDYNLTREGYRVSRATTGEEALSMVRADPPGLVILDLMLPGIDGMDVCKAMRADTQLDRVPIIMLTAKGDDSDIVTGLELGADDYIVKPFSPRVLLARVKAALRRRIGALSEADSSTIVRGAISIDPERREVRVSGKLVELTYTEFALLRCLAKRPGRVFTRYQIIDAIRGDDYHVTDRAVDVQVVGLRKKMGELGKLIETVRGVGYRFRDE